MVLRRRFLLLRATRWFPTGLVIPVLVLLLVDRGFSLGQIGLAAATQGITVLVLELPTGGLADALGRRPVLLVATAIELIAMVGLLIAQSLPALIVVFALWGVFRALESGPLDAWYVDAAKREDPDVDLERSLASGGTVTGLAIAAGALLSGGLVALDPLPGVNALAVPLVVALCLRAADLVVLAVLMVEDRTPREEGALRRSIAEVPGVIAAAFGLVRRSRVLAALLAVEFFWGFGMTSFETLPPAKLAEATGDIDSAAALFGPAATAAWIAAAGGAALAPRFARRLGTPGAAMALHTLQAAVVVGMAIAAGPAGVIVMYIAAIATHGAINPLYQTLLHEQADAANRVTVLSTASMATQTGGALGVVVLGALADSASVSTAIVVGAIVLLFTGPFYFPAMQERRAYIGSP